MVGWLAVAGAALGLLCCLGGCCFSAALRQVAGCWPTVATCCRHFYYGEGGARVVDGSRGCSGEDEDGSEGGGESEEEPGNAVRSSYPPWRPRPANGLQKNAGYAFLAGGEPETLDRYEGVLV